jgi:hypothetical protein
MRILYITSCWPHGESFGGQLRVLNIGRALKAIGDVTVMVVSSDTASERNRAQTATEFAVLEPPRLEIVRNSDLRDRLRWALDTRFLNVHGCQARPEDQQRIAALTSDFDLTWVHHSRTPNILNRWHWPKSVLDLDDIPSTYQHSIWQNGVEWKTKWKARAQMTLLKRRERRLLQRFSVLSVCSKIDREYLGGGPRIHVIPNGFERPTTLPVRKRTEVPRIGFIGLYSYAPNLEGVRWFVDRCWPDIKKQIPDVRLRLVGKETDGPLKPAGPDIDALGWVADPAAEIATWSAMIIPIRHGAGTRIKIADAFSRKCPTVSTRLGAYGYDVENGRELLLADSPKEFTDACLSLIRDPVRADEMADRAYGAFLQNWTWEAIAPRVWKAAETAVGK